MSFFKNLFGKKRDPELDIEKAVGEYLLKLPRCSNQVVIVSPKYGQHHYTCEIMVEAMDLLPWAEHHAEATWNANREAQAAKKTLPLWLRGADSNNNTKSYVPHFMYAILRPYVRNVVDDGTTRIYCLECDSFVADVNKERLDEMQNGPWSFWTDVWKCPQGHQLYYAKQEAHFYIRR